MRELKCFADAASEQEVLRDKERTTDSMGGDRESASEEIGEGQSGYSREPVNVRVGEGI